MDAFANILATFGANIGMDGLAAENQVCTLQFDEVIVNIEYQEDQELVWIYSQVCPLPESDADKLALYGLLLELNSFFKGTDGAVLGIEPLLNAVTCTRRLPLAHLDAAALDGQVARHVDTVESLRASIAQLADAPAAAEAPAATGWNSGMLRI